ncbi:MAG: gfo/Idh/MocA family oxidoreductase [Alphaproteobacteria bacterium]|nr:gfo/Idh/MocA family oxidoreductase [Alphaproteobacteria bacterium]
MTRIGLIGCGMWGRNLARNLAQLGVLGGVADLVSAHAEGLAAEFDVPAMNVSTLLGQAKLDGAKLDGAGLDGVVIATAAPTHRDLACRALAAGLHVFVEKPLALDLEDAEAIAATARNAGRQVMVGHLIRYHDAFLALQEHLAAGLIGTIRHVSANRLAMGRIRATESVIYDLCPHDLSLILALMGEMPHQVSSRGASHITPGLPDMTSTWLGFSGGRSAMMTTGWMCPYKEHRLSVTGERGSLVFDDTRPWAEKLTLYRDEITPDGANFAITRAAPIQLPVPESEPLKQEMRAFIACCETGAAPPTDIADGLAVQRILQTIDDTFTEFGAAPGSPDVTLARKG